MTKQPQEAKEWFEQNFLDGDCVQTGQMISSQEALGAVQESHRRGVEEGQQWMLKMIFDRIIELKIPENEPGFNAFSEQYNDGVQAALDSLPVLNP